MRDIIQGADVKVLKDVLLNINYNKIQVCSHFFYLLAENLHNTFLGYNVIKSYSDKEGYVNWSYNQTCKKIKELYNFDFSTNEVLKSKVIDFAIVQIFTDFDIEKRAKSETQKNWSLIFCVEKIINSNVELIKQLLIWYSYFYNEE